MRAQTLRCFRLSKKLELPDYPELSSKLAAWNDELLEVRPLFTRLSSMSILPIITFKAGICDIDVGGYSPAHVQLKNSNKAKKVPA